jgi:hypothetical protein
LPSASGVVSSPSAPARLLKNSTLVMCPSMSVAWTVMVMGEPEGNVSPSDGLTKETCGPSLTTLTVLRLDSPVRPLAFAATACIANVPALPVLKGTE